MRIERLQIDGFGHFHGRDFGPFESPLTVLYGPNEAGKSTTLDFIRAMLFGIPGRMKPGFHAPMAGGQHGGKITLRGEDKRHYVVERIAGARGGTIRVTTGEGQIFETDAELRRLLGQATEAMYENVFAFGLGELQTSKSLEGAEVSGQIYSAGLGAANLPRAVKKLTDSAEAVFKPGGSNQRVAEILNELQAIEARLETVRGDSAEYGRLTARLEVIAAELAAASEEAGRFSRRAADLERLRKGWAEWLPLADRRARRAVLPTIEHFPASAIARLEAGETSMREAKEARRAAFAETEAASALAGLPVRDEALLPDAHLIEQLRRQRGSFDDSLRDLPKREREASDKQRDLQAALAGLGATWAPARVMKFDLCIALRDEVEQWRTRLEGADREAREAQIAARAEAITDSQANETLSEAQQALDRLPAPELNAEKIGARRAVVRETRTALDQLLRAQSSREDAERVVEVPPMASPLSPPLGQRGLALGAALLAILAIGAGLVLGGSSALLGLLVGVPLLGVAAFVAKAAARAGEPRAVASFVDDGRIARATAAEAAAHMHLHETAGPLGGVPRDPGALDALEVELDRGTAVLANWTAANERLAIATRDADRAGRRRADAQNLAEECGSGLADSRAEWGARLEALGLPVSLAPATAATMLDRIGYAQGVIDDVAAADHRAAAIEQDIRNYRERVLVLAVRHGLTVGEAPASAGAVADELCRRFDAALKAAAARQSARAPLADCERRLNGCEERLAESLRVLDALLAAAGVSDVEAFRKLAALHAEAAALDQEIREAEQKIVVLSGPGAQFTAFLDTLAATSIGDLEAESGNVLSALEQAATRRDLLLDERGSASARLASLSNDETASELRARRESLIEELRSKAREWSTLTLARHLLERARSKYEAERQPDAIKHAQAFFRTVTGGRYQTLISPLGSNNVTIIGQDGGHKNPEQLSRGTQEQLYLAMRFGLIRQFAENAEPLPVVVDDILVNFDPERAYRAAKAFSELARTNQVLVFTCHPATAELFKTADSRTQVIPLSGQARLLG